MSKSWMVMSRNMPPETSGCSDRRRRGVAADDVHQAGLADFAALDSPADANEVCVEAAVEADLKLHAGSFYRSQPIDCAKLMAMGFSQKMCFPAVRACTIRSAWILVGEQISTASILRIGQMFSALDSATLRISQRTAIACAASRLTSVTAMICASGRRKASVSACTRPMRPAPMIPNEFLRAHCALKKMTDYSLRRIRHSAMPRGRLSRAASSRLQMWRFRNPLPH